MVDRAPARSVGIRPEGATTRRSRLPGWRREALRTTLWLVPVICVGVAVALFFLTYALDEAVYHRSLGLPWWIRTSGADAGRAVLIGIAAAVITVVGVLFSITILALTLASQQFGPRMLRTFIRDLGTQLTLGIFVASFVYAVLNLGAITDQRGSAHPPFVPHIGVTISEALMFVDIAVLIYFIHHIAVTIQLPEVIARIAKDLGKAIDEGFPEPVMGPKDARNRGTTQGPPHSELQESEVNGPSATELTDLLDREGLILPASQSGYLQFVGYGPLLAIAENTDAVIRLVHRPGHFVLAGRPLATVWPASRADEVVAALASAHITGPQRTLAQDPVFAIDQLAEIAIRALSAAVNDTFTALTCIDWLADGLCNVSGRHLAEGVYRDRHGKIRLLELDPSYARMVNRSFDKIRQAARGMPAVLIRLMDGLANVAEYTISPEQRHVVRRQADMVLRAGVETITEPEDLVDLRARYARFEEVAKRLDAGVGIPRSWPRPPMTRRPSRPRMVPT